jgi:hypothetical protein
VNYPQIRQRVKRENLLPRKECLTNQAVIGETMVTQEVAAQCCRGASLKAWATEHRKRQPTSYFVVDGKRDLDLKRVVKSGVRPTQNVESNLVAWLNVKRFNNPDVEHSVAGASVHKSQQWAFVNATRFRIASENLQQDAACANREHYFRHSTYLK